MNSADETGLGGLFGAYQGGAEDPEEGMTEPAEGQVQNEAEKETGESVSLKAEDLVHKSKSELYGLAQEMNIEGRGSMLRTELLLFITRTRVTEQVERIVTADMDEVRSMASEKKISGRGKMNMAELQERLLRLEVGGGPTKEGGTGAGPSGRVARVEEREAADEGEFAATRSSKPEQDAAEVLVEIYVNRSDYFFDDGVPKNRSTFLGFCTERLPATVGTKIFWRRSRLKKSGTTWTKSEWLKWLKTHGIELKQSLGEGQRSVMHL